MSGRRDHHHRSRSARALTRRVHTTLVLAVAASSSVLGVLAPQPASAAPAAPQKATVARQVQDSLATKGSSDIWLVFNKKANLTQAAATTNWVTRGQNVVDTLRTTAKSSQAEARKVLSAAGADYTPYWISNRILVRNASTELTTKLTGIAGVSKVMPLQTFKVDPLEATGGGNQVNSVEWGVAAINADDVWNQFGVRGEGITVANIDTGAQFDHPALVGKYRGNQGDGTFDHNYNWFDGSDTCPDATVPCDNNGHGSHTMGTMVGDDGAGNQIGVAPNARWIAAKGCGTDQCADQALLDAGQWILEPRDVNGENPRVDLRPNIVNNSWGAPNFSVVDPWYDETIQAWTAAGIWSTFSNGNEGPGCDSTGSPGDSLSAYGIGAFDINGRIASFSSRGPGDANGTIRPNISAPGVNVRSSVPGNGYANFNGTSMAAPHVSGAVALIWSAAPALIGDIEATRTLLNQTAIDTSDLTCGGTPENNNVWGEGKLDVLAAVTAAPRGDTGVLSGTVTDSTTGEPVAGATLAINGPLTRTVTSGADGTYGLTLSVGDYTVDTHAFGYADMRASATVTTDTTTTQDFALVPAPRHSVSGTVADARGQPLSGLAVAIDNTPIDGVTTGADGTYTFESVPEGTYTVTATGTACNGSQSLSVTVDGDEDVDFTLPDRTDAYGYRCIVAGSSYVEAGTVFGLTGDDATAPLDLPFPVVHYGDRYTQVNVSTNGHLSFTAPSTSLGNVAIPSAGTPNAAIYAFWDDLVIDADASIRSSVTGSAPNRSLVIEWRNARIFGAGESRIDAEAVISEGGDVTLAWRNINAAEAREMGSSATVGIENAAGTDALQYSFNQAVLADATSVRFTLPTNGFVTGTVTDKNDNQPIVGATVTVSDGDSTVRQLRTGTDGSYFTQVFVGSYTLAVSNRNYNNATANVSVATRQTVTTDLSLTTARAEFDGPQLRWVVPQNNTQHATVSLTNTGSSTLDFESAEVGGGQVTAKPAAKSPTLAAKADPNARTTRGSYTDAAIKGAVPQAAGDVLATWPVSGASVAWGVGYTGKVWVSDPDRIVNTEFEPSGTATGREWPATWAGTWNADMAFDSARGQLCQVNVGGDNGIYCWDPATGAESYHLTGSPWSGISQRGVAYRPDDDSFYVGGWNEDVIYHVAGASSATPGETLGQCDAPADASVAGLAYNRAAGVLFVTTNTPTSPILQMNPATCEVISEIGFPENEEFAGAGAELDELGNLWVTSQVTNTAYQVDTGVPEFTDAPWLSVSPTTGSLAPGASTDLTVSIDSTGLSAGVYRATLVFSTNSGRQSTFQLPVEIVVAGYWTGVDAGGTGAYTDVDNLPWVADQAYRTGRFGWVGDSTVNTAKANVDIRDTKDDALYRSQRQGMTAYRFDALPAGKYEVTLDFAELARSPKVDWRMFDVDVNGQFVLVGYDIAQTIGGRRADRRSFVVEVAEGGSIQVNFHDRRSYKPSVINSLRVVQRPDL